MHFVTNQKVLKLISLFLVIKEVPQSGNAMDILQFKFHRLFRNILKNASLALRYHFATANNIHVIFFYI